MEFKSVSVIGLGYVGLPTATMFASRKMKVIGVDVNQGVVDTINQGKIHIVEPELEIPLHAAVTEGYLRAATKPEPADAFLIAVPTPFKGDHEPDLTYIEAACQALAPVLQKGNLVVLESTSPVGTTEQIAEWLAEARPDLTFPQTHGEQSDIFLAHSPERVLPGRVMQELIKNDRVIGGLTQRCSKSTVDLYKIFVQGDCIITNARTAEMAKLTENSFRDVNIAFANELSLICEKLGINVWELIELANRHPRVNILQPGPGVGGHCIAVDPWFIVKKTPEKAKLIHAARLVNDNKPQWVLERVEQAIADFLSQNPEKSIQDITVACFGLAFKPDIDDLRESPSLEIACALQKSGSYQVVAIEPNVNNSEVMGIPLVDMDRGLRADVLVLLVDHSVFRQIKPPKAKIIVDTRGIWQQ
jgi:UDP-N-acetyl-D-mannosaminuronic acid dehydrogenase